MAQIETLEEAIEVILGQGKTIERLDTKLKTLSQQVNTQKEACDQMLVEANKAIDLSKHLFRVDHCGYIWTYDVEAKEYHKTEMRIGMAKLTPEAIDKLIKPLIVEAAQGFIKAAEDLQITKQDVLISGRNIKTINGQSILGEGNLTISAGDTPSDKTCGCPKHVFLTQEEYDALEVKEKGTLYFIVENKGDEGWTFGDNFPIILSGDWGFGDSFPIVLE